MAETKWTGGRWTFDRETGQVDCDGGTVAHDIGWAPNGRLIAAAPDLAAALAALLAEHRDMNAALRTIGRGVPEDGAHPDCPADMARCALARARGEEG